MPDDKKHFPLRLFENGIQIGGNSTFGEWGESAEAVCVDMREYFESEGFVIDSIVVEDLKTWESEPAVPTIVIRMHTRGS